ncbi:hypothetical protein [Sulfurospirillum arcachonense]|uniref:hypothetical protein n=1 Tax=Sulfurospirillum arcachonense TaxID=57666 RepID=UPI00046838E4|nr:hypothetical protein [Sulfurospirillum arcachonense]
MSEKYFGTVVKIIDDYSVVINAGSNQGISKNDCFVVIGIGDIIVDPDTGEELEKLEVVKGKVQVLHIQDKISTVKSFEYDKSPDKKEIKKVESSNSGLGLFGANETVTESITPGKSTLKQLQNVKIGDKVLKI